MSKKEFTFIEYHQVSGNWEDKYEALNAWKSEKVELNSDTFTHLEVNESDVRYCHLCDGIQVDKYCINDTCAEYGE